jgi:hypothetical protein
MKGPARTGLASGVASGMNVFAGSIGQPLLGVLLILSVGLIAYFSRDSFRKMLTQRKEQRNRQRQRQQFWGYE